MRGRKPIPTDLKRARGNPGKRPLNEDEPKPDKRIPLRPDYLDEEACKEWDRVAPLLAKYGIITELDGPALAGYCQSYSTYSHAMQKVNQHGPV